MREKEIQIERERERKRIRHKRMCSNIIFVFTQLNSGSLRFDSAGRKERKGYEMKGKKANTHQREKERRYVCV